MEPDGDMSCLGEFLDEVGCDGMEFNMDGDEFAGDLSVDFLSTSNGPFGDPERFTQPNQQVIIKEQVALGVRQRGGLVHSYSHNDLRDIRSYHQEQASGLLQAPRHIDPYGDYPQAPPRHGELYADIPGHLQMSPCDSPPSSGENGYARSGLHPLQQSPGSKGSFSRLESIPESSMGSMGGHAYGPNSMQPLDVKPPHPDMDFMSAPTSYGAPSSAMYADANGMAGGSMPHMMAHMDPMRMHPYQSPSGVGSPALLPTDMCNVLWADVGGPVDVSSGMLSPPPALSIAAPSGALPPAGMMAGDASAVPSGHPGQPMPPQDSKLLQEYPSGMMGGASGPGQNGKPPVAPVPQLSGESIHSQAHSSGSSGGPPPLPSRRTLGGPGGPHPLMGMPPMSKASSGGLLRRTQSAVELHSMNNGMGSRRSSATDLTHMVELTTPEGHTYRVGRLSHEERNQKILRYRQKRHERNFTKRIKYQCRKTLADSRPRVRGRFARNDDAGAVMPHETKKAQKARIKQEAAAANTGIMGQAADSKQHVKAVEAPPPQQPPPAQQQQQHQQQQHNMNNIQNMQQQGLPPLIHSTALPSMGPGSIMNSPGGMMNSPGGMMHSPHSSPQYSHSGTPSPLYMTPHHMFGTPPHMPQQSYMGNSYGTPTRYHPQQGQVQSVRAGQHQYIMAPQGSGPYANGGYPNGAYVNGGYAGSMASPHAQTLNGTMIPDMQPTPVYMYQPHGAMDSGVTYAPTMSHPQQG